MADTSLRQALEKAIRARTCPPVHVLRSEPEQCRRHVANCGACQRALKSTGASVVEAPQKNEAVSPMPGDICVIAPPVPATEFFDAGRIYYNPPEVLVLDEDDGSGLVRVAQLFSESALASQGDLRLGHGTDYYAQCWNVYGMYVGHLSSPLRSTRPEFARLVLEKSREPFLPVAVNGPLWQFRQCELAAGSFFALPSVSHALGLLEERHGVAPSYPEPASWILDLPPSREAQLYEFAYAASDGAQRFTDRRTGSSVEIQGCKISVESRHAHPLGFLFLDGSGNPVPLHKTDLGTQVRASAFSESAISADSAYLVLLGPDEHVTLRVASDAPKIANIRVFSLKNE